VAVSGAQRSGSRERALLVAAVTDGGPASQAGIYVGDLITDLDGHAIASPEELFDLLLGDRVGRTVTVRLIRGASQIELPVTIGERPKD